MHICLCLCTGKKYMFVVHLMPKPLLHLVIVGCQVWSLWERKKIANTLKLQGIDLFITKQTHNVNVFTILAAAYQGRNCKTLALESQCNFESPVLQNRRNSIEFYRHLIQILEVVVRWENIRWPWEYEGWWRILNSNYSSFANAIFVTSGLATVYFNRDWWARFDEIIMDNI